jgi:hypothetical protein
MVHPLFRGSALPMDKARDAPSWGPCSLTPYADKKHQKMPMCARTLTKMMVAMILPILKLRMDRSLR